MSELYARALPGLPEIAAGEDLAALIADAVRRGRTSGAPGSPREGANRDLCDGEVVAIAHKAVSKAEGAVVALADVQPSPRARQLASVLGAAGDGRPRDPRVVQTILDQSSEIVRAQRGVLICRTHHGFVCANAGVDASNAAAGGDGDGESLIVLPADPDASARRLRARLGELTGARVAVLITDSFGRAWRQGQCDVALGCAGMSPLDDWRGRTDGAGRELTATLLAVADAAAATADLARAKDSGEPVVVLSGLGRFVTDDDGPGAAALLRPVDEDLFR